MQAETGDRAVVHRGLSADWRLFLILLGIFGIGLSQPFFGLIGENPTFFVAHRSGTADIIGLTLLIFLGPAAAVWSIAFAVERLAPSLARPLLPVGMALLTAVALAGYAWRPLDLQIEVALPLVILLSILAWVALRMDLVQRLMINLGWISFIFPVLFLGLSPVSGLLGGNGSSSSESGSLPDALNDTSVALIVFDELPLATMLDEEGQIDRARLPNFARLAEMSTWYRNATTVSTQTSVAVPALLSGELRTDDPAPTVSSYPSNLFTELATTHRVEAWESVTRLCPSDVCEFPDLGWSLLLDDSLIVVQNQVLPPGVAQRWVPNINNQWTRFRQPRVTRPRDVTAEDDWEFPWDDLEQDLQGQFRSLTGQIGTLDEPAFYYEHVLLPHSPWYFRPDGSGNEAEWIPWLDDNTWPVGPDHRRGVLMYAMQLELTDMLLGEFLDSVEATGRMDEMLIVVVADHGGALQEGLPARTLLPETTAELAAVPLFVKYPGQSVGVEDDRLAEITDVFPTIMDVMGIGELPAERMAGHRLNGEPPPGRTQILSVDPQQFQAAVDRFHSFVPPGQSAEPLFDALPR
ncbi:MAG: sulfatase-like hydrolase/transferase [Acidimicrobiales bacterium]|nr:sulfatase-like hydrolase/transferase [Acidimicrobiales bacterium]